MRTEGSAKRVTIATMTSRGAAVMDVSPANLAREHRGHRVVRPRTGRRE